MVAVNNIYFSMCCEEIQSLPHYLFHVQKKYNVCICIYRRGKKYAHSVFSFRVNLTVKTGNVCTIYFCLYVYFTHSLIFLSHKRPSYLHVNFSISSFKTNAIFSCCPLFQLIVSSKHNYRTFIWSHICCVESISFSKRKNTTRNFLWHTSTHTCIHSE